MCGDDGLPHPAKRRRLAHAIQGTGRGDGTLSPMTIMSSKSSREITPAADNKTDVVSKSSRQSVTPFLTEHLAQQYATQRSTEKSEKSSGDSAGSKYCYRHQPGRRQANEPSMDKLQEDLQTLSQSDQQGISHFWALFSAAPSKHRKLMLQGILSQCCFPQLSFLLSNVRELIKIDFLSALPTELGFQILRNLDTASLCKAAQVSRRWRAMADDDLVWHRMCEQHIARKCTRCGWGLPLLEQKRLMASKYNFQLRALGTDGDAIPEKRRLEIADTFGGTNQIPQIRPWKDVYRDRWLIGSNWKHGRYTARTFGGHDDSVMCLQFNDHVLATGSYDTTIKIWDVDTEQELRTLRGHSRGVRTLQFDDTKLISGSLDNTIKVWNWRTGECLRTISGHTAGVLSLHFFGRILASGSVDGTVRIWDFEGGSASCLRGHEDWVNCVRVDGPSRTVFSASDDGVVRLWDLDSGKTLRTYEGHAAQVQAVLPLPEDFECEELDTEALAAAEERAVSPVGSATGDTEEQSSRFAAAFSKENRTLPPHYMLTASLDNTIRLWDVHTGRCLRVSFGHVVGVWAIAADAMRIVSGAQDALVKVWDARSGQCERTIAWHGGPVTCLGMNDSRIASGSDDGKVKMLSFNYFRRAKVLAHECST